jgi:hypothetical protein
MAKRRKISAKVTPQEGIISVSSLLDLPVEPLSHVGSFLAAPSQALFAVALYTPPSAATTVTDTDGIVSSSPSPSSIIGHQRWDSLDFGEIEIELAKRLCDHDISNMLLSIDAVNKVKRLRLTNCINITGVGLQPLRRSAIIEYIDLSLTGVGQNSRMYENPAISRDEVLPILDSIIGPDYEGCAVRKIEFPLKWREERSTEFIEFLERYNALWIARSANNYAVCRCVKCERSAIEDDVWVDTEGEIEDIAQDVTTCTTCLNHICDDCNDFEEAEIEDLLLFSCFSCGKFFCVECSTPKHCGFSGGDCGYFYCTDCHVHIEQKCAACNANICDKCISNAKCSICEQLFCCYGDECRVEINPCPCCNEPVCSDCSSSIKCDLCPVQWCNRCADQGECIWCESFYCGDCQSKRRHKLSNIECNGCLRKIAAGLVGENEQLRVEKEELRKELTDLRAEG